jgi:hypothetical protein
MPHCRNTNLSGALLEKENSIVTAAKATSSEWRPKLLHISFASEKISVGAVKDVERRFPIN